MRANNVVSIGQVRRAARRRQAPERHAAASAPAPVLEFPGPLPPFALSAEAIDYAERIEMLIARGIPLAALDAMLRFLERRSA